MHVLLVQTVDRSRPVETALYPLGPAYLASSLRRSHPGIEVKIGERLSGAELDAFRPDLVGISSVTQNFGRARMQAALVASRGIPVVIGGVHISSLPESLPPEADVAVLGEGEETLAHLVGMIARQGSWWNGLDSIAGVAYRGPEGRLRITKKRPLIKNLDEIPFPARDLIGVTGGTAHMVSSRGCPYGCIFCSSSRFWAGARYFSAAYVIDEIRAVLDALRPGHITFWDDLFAGRTDRLREMSDAVSRSQALRAVEYSAACRPECVDEEVAGLLRRMGMVRVSLGLESGSDPVLHRLKGAKASVAANRRAVQCLDNAGFDVVGSFVVGAPWETDSNMMDTLGFIREAPLARVGVFILTPLPGTPLWETALERGLVSNDMDWSALRMDPPPGERPKVVLCDHVPEARLIEIHATMIRVARRKALAHVLSRTARNPLSILPAVKKRGAALLGRMSDRIGTVVSWR